VSFLVEGMRSMTRLVKRMPPHNNQALSSDSHTRFSTIKILFKGVCVCPVINLLFWGGIGKRVTN
jgi:hypothetical protein